MLAKLFVICIRPA